MSDLLGELIVQTRYALRYCKVGGLVMTDAHDNLQDTSLERAGFFTLVARSVVSPEIAVPVPVE